jgi:hypothetical protein
MAESMGADQVPDGAVIVLPLSQPEENQEIDFFLSVFEFAGVSPAEIYLLLRSRLF